MIRRIGLVIGAFILTSYALASCTTDEPRRFAQVDETPTSSPAPENPPDAPLVTTNPQNPPDAVKKILVVWVENHSYTQMLRDMPYVRGLGNTYAYAADSYGNYHPSQPNYIIAASGTTKGIYDNNLHRVGGSSIFGQAYANGKKGKTTADGMGSTNCRTSSTGAYRGNDHNPWTSFKDETALCQKYNKDYSTWKGIIEKGWLGNIHFLIPSDNHLAIIITADEDNKSSGQHVLTVVVHSSQKGRGKVDTPRLDQYSLYETLARVANVTPLGTKWKDKPDFATAFGLPIWKDPEVVTP